MDDTSTENSGEARLRAVALRFLTHRYHEQIMEAVDLLANRLPDDLPVEIPVMEDSHIVGSVTRVGDGYKAFSILLETDVSPERVRDYYDERLRAVGWQVPDLDKRLTGMHGGGFTFGMEEFWHPGYCLSTEGPALKVTSSELTDGSTEIHLALDTNPEESPCRPVPEKEFPPHWHEDFEQPLPNLTPPPKAKQHPQGGAGGGSDWRSNATVATDLDIDALQAHYGAQLQKAGWTDQGGGSLSLGAFSVWNYKGEEGKEWIGFLVIVEQPKVKPDDPNRYFLSVYSHKLGEDESRWQRIRGTGFLK